MSDILSADDDEQRGEEAVSVYRSTTNISKHKSNQETVQTMFKPCKSYIVFGNNLIYRRMQQVPIEGTAY